MNKILKRLGICALSLMMITGCTAEKEKEKDTNTTTNTTSGETGIEPELKKYIDKYNDDANNVLSAFADGDALMFIYENLGKDMGSYKLKDINGKEVVIANGEKTVIEFVSSTCSACVSAVKEIKTAEDKFDGKGYRFIQVFTYGKDKEEIDAFYKEAGVSHANTIIPYSTEVEKMVADLKLQYTPSILFIDEAKKVSLGMVGYTFSDKDFEELANNYAFRENKLYNMTADKKSENK